MIRYYFTIQLMSPHPRVRPRFSPANQWLPPKRRGYNVKRTAAVSTQPVTLVFEYDGNRYNDQGQTIQTRGLPYALSEHRTYSLYYTQGLICTVPYDATLEQVGDGNEDPSIETFDSDDSHASEEDEDQLPDWSELTFCPMDGDNMYMALARFDCERQRLRVQRPDQRWAQYFLPDRYQSLPQNRTSNMRYGGLAGHLPLLIGLIATALPVDRLQQLLPRIMSDAPHGPYEAGERGPIWA